MAWLGGTQVQSDMAGSTSVSSDVPDKHNSKDKGSDSVSRDTKDY